MQAQEREPALAGNRRDPVGFLPGRRLRPEPDGRAAVGIALHGTALAADAWVRGAHVVDSFGLGSAGMQQGKQQK